MSRWYALEWTALGAAPAVVALQDEAKEHLERLALLRSLDATVHLETRIVNPVARWIANGGDATLRFTDADRRAADRLFQEEEAHADAARQLRDAASTGGELRQPGFAARLQARERTSTLPTPLLRFLFVTVTETLLSARLTDHALAPDLREDVRSLLVEHARDERWHARFFARCARQALEELGPLRQPALTVLPTLVADYVDADTPAIARDLASVGMPPEQVEQVCTWIGDHAAERREPHLQRLAALLQTPLPAAGAA